MDVACPQCGNPNLDVDAQNSVVYCKKCGFAVRVDPQTGNVTPLSQGGAPAGGQQPQAPAAYRERHVLGMDPFTFFMIGTLVVLGATFAFNMDLLYALIGIAIVVFLYWKA